MGLNNINTTTSTSKIDRLILADMRPDSEYTLTMNGTGFTVGLGKIANLFYRLLFTRKGSYFADPDFGSEFPDILCIPFGSEAALSTFIGKSIEDIEAYIRNSQADQELPDDELLKTISYKTAIVDLRIEVYVRLVSEADESTELFLDEALFDQFIKLT